MIKKMFLALPLFAAIQTAHAASSAFDSFMGKVVGNSTTVTFAGDGSPVVTSSAKLGNPTVGNMDISTAAGKTEVSGNVKIPLGTSGKTAAASARGVVNGANLVRGIRGVVGGPGGLAMLSLPYFMDWLETSQKFRVNPQTGNIEEAKDNFDLFCQASTNYPPPPGLPAIGSKSSAGCGGLGEGTVVLQMSMNPGGTSAVCKVGNTCHPSIAYKSWGQNGTYTKNWLPSSLDDVANYLDTPEPPMVVTPQVFQEVVTKTGVNPFTARAEGRPIVGPVALSGPSTVPGEKTTTSEAVKVQSGTTTEVTPGTGTGTDQQDGTKQTTKTTTYNITYQGDKISYTTTTTTTTNITNNTTNETSTETPKTETKEDESSDDVPVDTPLGGIPELYVRKYPDGMVGIWNEKKDQLKQTQFVQLVDKLLPKNVSGGSCPRFDLNLQFTSWANYGTKQVDYPCWIWDAAKAVVIVSALILARALVFGG